MATEIIASRCDLSFTRTSDAPGVRSNWYVPHDPEGYWGDTVPIDRRFFSEIADLATVDEREAFDAIVAALNAGEWNHTHGGSGWGIERGFSERLAEAAIVGLRAIREGAATYDHNADNDD